MVARDLKGSLVRPVPVQVFLEALQVPLKKGGALGIRALEIRPSGG